MYSRPPGLQLHGVKCISTVHVGTTCIVTTHKRKLKHTSIDLDNKVIHIM